MDKKNALFSELLMFLALGFAFFSLVKPLILFILGAEIQGVTGLIFLAFFFSLAHIIHKNYYKNEN